MREIATYADGIGPKLSHIVVADGGRQWHITPLVELAHANGLVVHPYSLRADSLPEYASDLSDVLDIVFRRAGVDGVSTDFPDKASDYLRDATTRR